MFNNYPPGVGIKTITVDLECPHCGHCWSESVIIELGVITQDNYDVCRVCGTSANSY